MVRLGDRIAWEWPKGCWLWDHHKVCAIIDEFALDCAVFDGCAFGLKALAGKDKGKPIKKLWAIATDSPSIVQSLGT